jgi:hypothetical protein
VITDERIGSPGYLNINKLEIDLVQSLIGHDFDFLFGLMVKIDQTISIFLNIVFDKKQSISQSRFGHDTAHHHH